MGGLFGALARGLETKATDFSALTWEALLGAPAKSGVDVNIDSALRVTTLLAGTRVLAEGVAQIPLGIFKESDDGSYLPQKANPLWKLLWRRPNDWMTSFEFRECLMFHAVLTGNGFAYKNELNGVVRELIPLIPGSVTVMQLADYELVYQVSDPNGGIIGRFPRESILHLKGPTWNGYLGMDTIRLAREALGLAIATEESHARLHGNGAQPGGLLTVPGSLSPEARDRLKANFQKAHEGVQNAFKTVVLDNGSTWTPMNMKGVDAQHLETRKFQIEEICRTIRVLPLMVGFQDKATTYASAEQLLLAHVVHSIMPWVQRWTEVLDRDLGLTDAGLEARFNVRGLLRGDAASMAEYYASGIINGWLVRNEARREEGLNPLPGLDEPLIPLNLGTVGQRDDLVKSISSEVKSLIGHNGGPDLDDAAADALETKLAAMLTALPPPAARRRPKLHPSLETA